MIENYSEIKSLLDKVFALLQQESVRSQQTIARLEKRVEVLERQLAQRPTAASSEQQVVSPKEQTLFQEEQPEVMSNVIEEEIVVDDQGNTIMEVEDDFWDDDSEDAEMDAELQWMIDMPGESVEDVREAIAFSDRIYFIRELFMDDEEQYEFTLDRINETRSFAEVVSEMRAAFEWDEDSDQVYRFYMAVRRRFE